jgi:hypothetical protein
MVCSDIIMFRIMPSSARCAPNAIRQRVPAASLPNRARQQAQMPSPAPSADGGPGKQSSAESRLEHTPSHAKTMAKYVVARKAPFSVNWYEGRFVMFAMGGHRFLTGIIPWAALNSLLREKPHPSPQKCRCGRDFLPRACGIANHRPPITYSTNSCQRRNVAGVAARCLSNASPWPTCRRRMIVLNWSIAR